MEKKEITIKIPVELAGNLSAKMKDAGFEKLTPYICYILEQVAEDDSSDEDLIENEKEIRERLKELGYI